MIMKDIAMTPGSVYTDCWRGKNARPNTDEAFQESSFLKGCLDAKQKEKMREKLVKVT